MKRLLHLTTPILFAVLALASCKKSPINEQPTTLSLSKTSETIPAGDDGKTQKVTFNVTASGSWSLATDGSNWLEADVEGGDKGQTTVTLTVGTNPGGERIGNVYIQPAGRPTKYAFKVTQRGSVVLKGVNQWIWNELAKSYYWNKAIRAAAVPDPDLAPQAFLTQLAVNARAAGAFDTTEKPYTIDGSYDWSSGVAKPMENYCYSNIHQTSATRTADEAPLFGFAVENFVLEKKDDTHYTFALLVKWVQPGTPAANAGLKRGMWITKFEGRDLEGTTHGNRIVDGNVLDLIIKIALTKQGDSMTLGAGYNPKDQSQNHDYSLAAIVMVDNPIIKHEVLTTTGGKKVGYLVYNAFETGGRNDDEGVGDFDRQLRTIFGGFKADGVTEMVLDLRYNGGGAVSSCRILSSLMGDVNSGQVFTKFQYNPEFGTGKNNTWNFLNEPNSLKLKRIYILATDDSASSSELVINSLRGVDIDVVLIGTRTEGKNVGMNPTTSNDIDGARYEMMPITFKTTNAKGFCDYAGGFEPNYMKDEFWNLKKGGSGKFHDFGDHDERLLGTALTLIDGGQVTGDDSAATRLAEGLTHFEVDPQYKPVTGMILYENQR